MTDPDRAAAPAKRRPPLAGVRILAVSQFGAGPFGTQVLADLGAEVIKIEDPGVGGDVARYVPPFEGVADSPYFQSFNRHEQVRAREMIVEVDHPEFGRLREVRSPIRTEGEIRAPARAPKLGEHTEAILSEMLRYSDGTIARLRAAGAIG